MFWQIIEREETPLANWPKIKEYQLQLLKIRIGKWGSQKGNINFTELL